MEQVAPYKPINNIRIVTAASLFDGHDAAINIMRRIIQATGCEVIHLGHDRSVEEVVNCAIQEDAQAIAMTSYQGGHIEYFKYMFDLLKEKGAPHIKIFGGGGGTILPSEIEELHAYGITRIYHPDDGRALGLQGMINDLVQKCDFPVGTNITTEPEKLADKNVPAIARVISAAENFPEENTEILNKIRETAKSKSIPVLGITGTGGAGKSSLVDELVRRFLIDFSEKQIAVVSVDPSKRKTGGALLGDRIRMNSIKNERVYMRSLATRQSNLALSKHVAEAISILKAANYDLIILETSGIGQSDTEILDHSDVSLYVMTPEYGAATQLEKIDMLDFADVIALNKFDKRGALDALRDVRKQYQRNHNLWEKNVDEMPVYGTIASQFNDPGMNSLYKVIMDKIVEKTKAPLNSTFQITREMSEKIFVIPPDRTRYLSEISENNRSYDKWVNEQVVVAEKLYGLNKSIQVLTDSKIDDRDRLIKGLQETFENEKLNFDPKNWAILQDWDEKKQSFKNPEYQFKVRDKILSIQTHTKSLSHSDIPKVATPRYSSWGDILRWVLQENFPGEFPYTSGLFPFKREGEDPTRMFAGEGGPERTNKRFHYVSLGMPAKRLSTAFDSVTLYGNDPDLRPDIYGKIGNSGVSICCLDDAKKLYSGFDLSHPATSVSMTINGPAPMLLAFFMNAAIDQNCEKYIKANGLEAEIEAKIEAIYTEKGTERPRYQGALPEGNDGLGLMLLGVTGDQVLPSEVYAQIKAETLKQVRGTVQADILKEDQAQNTCIFSTEFALRLMGDVQQYFINNGVRNFYSVSISGYHIAEAGANPITQLAFTLANGFTYVEYYLSRGMSINDFGPNLSFFFSNGIDPEYAVIGRVARRIWAKALAKKYGANSRAQMLKYHIQTSGRSLHAQEIDFNDIRTTLQALYAIYDNCNSLHTNAYDEAITTPTEESVRRAMAIQLIINRELGLAKNENPLQGSFIIEELTDLVEEAVLTEFDRITERGGVLGAMETMYQRSKIQEESLYYETLKHTGEFPIIGVNTFLSSKGSPTVLPKEVIRATEEEKQYQISMLGELQRGNSEIAKERIKNVQEAAVQNRNMFEELMETCKYASLGQITNALFEVGGQYRRKDIDALNNLYSELIVKRHELAVNAGFENFRDYKFQSLGRFDYTKEDCFNFHQAIKTLIVPLVREIQQKKLDKLGKSKFKPWDAEVDPEGKAPLKPFQTGKEMLDGTISILGKIDSYFADCIQTMDKMGHLDLESKTGKAPGGYNYPLYEIGVPFIFMNAVGAQRDLVTMVHEAGHAVHSFLSRDLKLTGFKNLPSEVAELASMSMEMLTMNYWDLFYKNQDDLNRAKREQLEGILKILPWIAQIDAFQHWVYENVNHSIVERYAYWKKLSSDYGTGLTDWSGYEDMLETSWQRQMHLFEVPFYYIEYGIAQLGALGVWKNSIENFGLAIENYKEALKLGYTKSIPEIYETANVKFDFSESYLKSLADFIKEELTRI